MGVSRPTAMLAFMAAMTQLSKILRCFPLGVRPKKTQRCKSLQFQLSKSLKLGYRIDRVPSAHAVCPNVSFMTYHILHDLPVATTEARFRLSWKIYDPCLKQNARTHTHTGRTQKGSTKSCRVKGRKVSASFVSISSPDCWKSENNKS